MKRLFYVGAAALLCALLSGCALLGQSGAEETASPDPHEGMTFWQVEPLSRPAFDAEELTVLLSENDIISRTNIVFRGRVSSVTEYELPPLPLGTPGGHDFVSLIECTVIDPIYGELEEGGVVSMFYGYSTHRPVGDVQTLMPGDECIFLLEELTEEWAGMQAYDYKGLADMRIVSPADGIMMLDRGEMVTYTDVFGDFDGEAVQDGRLRFASGNKKGLRIAYGDMRKELLRLLDKRDRRLRREKG